MKRYILPIVILSCLIVAVVGVSIILKNNNTVTALPDPTIDIRQVNGKTVYEVRSYGEQTRPQLAPDNSHKGVMFNLEDTANGKSADRGFYFDLANFSQLIQNPQGVSVTDPVLSQAGSSFHTDGSTIVWAEFYGTEFPGGKPTKIRGYNIANQTYIDISVSVGPHRAFPMVSGRYVVWSQKSSANSDLNIKGYDLQTSQEFDICIASGDQSSPRISGNIVCWNDQRNYASTGNDIYGFNLTTMQEFAVCTAQWNQGNPVCNSRYICYTGGDDEFAKGIFAYDTTTGNTITLTATSGILISANDRASISNGDSPENTLVAWTEYITNNNGTFFVPAYKKISEAGQPTHYLKDIQTLASDYTHLGATQTHVAYKDAGSFSFGKPWVYKISDNSHTMLDDASSTFVTMDNTYVMWQRWRDADGELWNICCTTLP